MIVTTSRLHHRLLGVKLPKMIGYEPLLVVLADGLFWDHPIGVSLPLYLMVLVAIALGSRSRRPTRAAIVAVLGVMPLVEDPNVLSLPFGLLAVALSIEIGASPLVPMRRISWKNVVSRIASGPWRVAEDFRRWRRLVERHRAAMPSRRGAWLAWIVPPGLFAVFLTLFATANPVIADRLADVLPTSWPAPSWPDLETASRPAFWSLVLVGIWPILRSRPLRRRVGAPGGGTGGSPNAGVLAAIMPALMGPESVSRSLVLFNLLFGLQLALDGAFLWVGVTLPDGLTYAAYAHRGAYPLVVAALMAGGFVILIRRGDGPRSARLTTTLAFLFTGQTVVLMLSSMRRLALYVEAYSLTEWRVATFVWMLLVAIGLALIMAQLAMGRRNAWLIARLGIATAAVLYGCCFIDVPFLVASFNVAHCAEQGGAGPTLDIETVMDLGSEAIPAVDRYLKNALPESRRRSLEDWRAAALVAVRAQSADWRGWSFRAWRLHRYLDRSGATEPAPMVPDRPGDGDPQAQ